MANISSCISYIKKCDFIDSYTSYLSPTHSGSPATGWDKLDATVVMYLEVTVYKVASEIKESD
jgi:hypothetical protein